MKKLSKKYSYTTPAKTGSSVKNNSEEKFFGETSNQPFFLPSSGNPLPVKDQQFYSSKFGHDLNHVRIHTGPDATSAARSINAKAFTSGNHIVFNEYQFDNSSPEGKRLLAHELVHVLQSDKQPGVAYCQPASGKAWETWIKNGLEDFNNGKPDEAERNFVAALKDIGYAVNVARDGRKNVSLLKPGLNLDILYTDHAGESGFLTNGKFLGRMPQDDPGPQFTEIIGRHAFRSATYIYTKMVIEHEKAHTEHHKRTWEIYKAWAASKDAKGSKGKILKQQQQLAKIKPMRNADEIERDNAQLKINQAESWLGSQSKIKAEDKELFSEIAGTMRAEHWDTEVLAGLYGFISGFHDIPIVKGQLVNDLFDELTFYPVQKKFWNKADAAVKKRYENDLTRYYRDKLSAEQRAAFDQQAKDYKSRSKDADAYFAMIANVQKTGK